MTPQKKRRPVKQAAFLAAYAKTGNVSTAARKAKCSRSLHYEWMADEAYRAEFERSHEEACELLEEEARHRAVEGTEEPIVYQGEITTKRDSLGRATKRPQTIRRYSDTLLIFLMKGAMPEKYKDRVEQRIQVSVDIASRLAAARQRLQQPNAGLRIVT
jgi:hypothetical protein